MGEWHGTQGPFDVPDVVDYIPRRLKPWLFIFFVLIVQFSGGIYLAAVTSMVGSTALMQEDVLMAGYASLIGMSVNFAVMFRIKFRFSTRTQLLVSGIVLLAANVICAHTASVPLLVGVCFIAGWFRMQATLACNSTIQLWLTPVRDMAVFFCYVYLVVDSVIQLSGIATVYVDFFFQWEYMQWIMTGLLALMLLMVLTLLKPVRAPLYIPLLGIDWLGAALWSVFFLCFTYVCVYGEFHDWWDSSEIVFASLIGIFALLINLWRATFLHHPYISLKALTNRNVVRATLVYLVFFTMLATEHVAEHSYASAVLGFGETDIIDLNWYVFAGIIAGCAFTYFTFALRRWSYRTMTAIAFALIAVYLGWFYFMLDYGVEKEALFFPLFIRGASSVIISIIYLTSRVQSGLPFTVFPQALTVNGFTGAVMGAAFGPAVIGVVLKHLVARKYVILAGSILDTDPRVAAMPFGELYGMVRLQSLAVSLKELYGALLIISIAVIILILLSYGSVKPNAFFPKWRRIRKIFRRLSLSPE